MLISEKATAAQAVSSDGARRFFDDPGCLAEWLAQQQAPAKESWVRVGCGWVATSAAKFAPGRTPMDYGFVGATAGVSWEDVRAAVAQKRAAREVSP